MPGLSTAGEPLDTAALFAPLARYGRLGLAVSGGADSLALLLLAHRHVQLTGGTDRFVVYSVDHGLRPEAAKEVRFVCDVAARYGLPARSLRWEGPKPGTGVQEAARQARYRLIGAAMQGDGIGALVTAHHLEDQAETVLMRLAHGSGLEGLRGMDRESQVEGVRVLRPLLDVDPDALRAEVASAGLVPVSDPGNLDLAYERVRWRQMLPQLDGLGLTARRLARFAERMRDADEALNAMAERAFVMCCRTAANGVIRINRDALEDLPRAVRVRLLRRALGTVGGWKRPHALAPVEDLVDRLLAGPLRTTLHGCLVRGRGNNIVIAPEADPRQVLKRAAEPSQA